MSSIVRVKEGKAPTAKTSEEFRKQLEGYGLTTAHILYRMPDHQQILQEYVWQEYDIFPKFPILNAFLSFWMEKLDGPLFAVKVAHSRLIRACELNHISADFRLN
jgi:uncharacterized protein Usg